MKCLVVGASGATGSLLVRQLLDGGHQVRAIARSSDRLPHDLLRHDRLDVIEAGISYASNAELEETLGGCDAVACCLGHNMTFNGIFGNPRRLVADATRRLCDAARAGASPVPIKFVLMNTAGNANRDLAEPVSFAQDCIIGMLRIALPPHVDNEAAADYLRTEIGQNDSSIEWVVVRPDTLLNVSDITEYEVHVSPTRSAIFNPGKTSRINVAHFMAELISNRETWVQWKGQMPVIYNV